MLKKNHIQIWLFNSMTKNVPIQKGFQSLLHLIPKSRKGYLLEQGSQITILKPHLPTDTAEKKILKYNEFLIIYNIAACKSKRLITFSALLTLYLFQEEWTRSMLS